MHSPPLGCCMSKEGTPRFYWNGPISPDVQLFCTSKTLLYSKVDHLYAGGDGSVGDSLGILPSARSPTTMHNSISGNSPTTTPKVALQPEGTQATTTQQQMTDCFPGQPPDLTICQQPANPLHQSQYYLVVESSRARLGT